jgi:hypothetical protein
MLLTRAEDAEQAVLAALILEPAALGTVSALLETDDFSQPRHSRIYSAMLRLSGRRRTIDPVTLVYELESLGDLAAIGGKDYIGWLLDCVPTAANVSYHAAIVREAARRRTLAAVLEEGSRLALAGQMGLPDIANVVRSALEAVEHDREDALRDAVRALDAAAPAPVRFIVEDLVTAGDIALFVGDGGSFKSSAAIHMAGAIAGGYRAFDRFKTQQSPVLIVSAEDPESVVRMRLEAFVAGHGWDRSRVLGNFHILADSGATLADERWRDHILEQVERTGAQFVVLDPVADMLSGDENSNSEMRAVLQFARALSAATSATPAFVHHAGKAGQEKRPLDRIRGASALASGARSILFFEDSDAGIRVGHLKMSRAPRLAPFVLQRAISSSPENHATWLTATLAFASERAVTRNRAEEFVVLQVTGAPRLLTTSDIKAAAKGTGISGEDVSRALRALQTSGRLAFETGPRNAKNWYVVTRPAVFDRVVADSLPSLPEPCPASSSEPADELAPLKGAGKLAGGVAGSGKFGPDESGWPTGAAE